MLFLIANNKVNKFMGQNFTEKIKIIKKNFNSKNYFKIPPENLIFIKKFQKKIFLKKKFLTQKIHTNSIPSSSASFLNSFKAIEST